MTPSSDDTVRRKADQESLFPGLAYVGAAAIGGAALVNHARSMPIKVLTPLAMATATGVYFFPAHTELVKSSWTRSPVARQASSANEQSMASSSMGDMKAASELSQGTNSSMDPVLQQHEQGKEQAKSWLDPWRTDSEKTGGQNKLRMNQLTPENPSSSRWSWWTRSEQMTPKGERDTKVQMRSEDPATSKLPSMSSSTTSERVERPLSTTTTVTTTTTMNTDPATAAVAQESPESQEETRELQQQQQQQQRRGSLKPRKIVVDKAIASAAIKGHDDIINRDSLMGKNTEETALKVHDNVIDAAVPKHRQSRHEKHPIELSRRASQSDKMDGRFIVRESQDPDAPHERVRRKSLKTNLHHGTENQDRRASMIFKGVENIEHSINKRIQKALEDEAEFWHQESMKEQANARGGERGM